MNSTLILLCNESSVKYLFGFLALKSKNVSLHNVVSICVFETNKMERKKYEKRGKSLFFFPHFSASDFDTVTLVFSGLGLWFDGHLS